jgi:putative NIF3 family GTP cyclohydrolase 1 type 2
VLGAPPAAGIRRLAICSGGAAADITEAAALGCDALLTGEPREDSHALGRELGVALIAAGHYATETFGIRALGEHLARSHDVQSVFITDDNPV